MSKINRVVEILMKRDGLTQKQAEKQLVNVSEEIQMAIADNASEAVEDIMMDELGLEMDYIEDVLGI